MRRFRDRRRNTGPSKIALDVPKNPFDSDTNVREEAAKRASDDGDDPKEESLDASDFQVDNIELEERNFRRTVIVLLVNLNVLALVAVLVLVFRDPFPATSIDIDESTEAANAETPAYEPISDPVPLPAVVTPPKPPPKKVAPRPRPKPRPPPVRVPEPEPAPAPVPGASAQLSVVVKGASAATNIAARVYVDGRFVGDAPLSSYTVAAGRRRVRVDCIFEGKTYRGEDQVMDIPPEVEVLNEHTCDVWVLPQ